MPILEQIINKLMMYVVNKEKHNYGKNWIALFTFIFLKEIDVFSIIVSFWENKY